MANDAAKAARTTRLEGKILDRSFATLQLVIRCASGVGAMYIAFRIIDRILEVPGTAEVVTERLGLTARVPIVGLSLLLAIVTTGSTLVMRRASKKLSESHASHLRVLEKYVETIADTATTGPPHARADGSRH